MEMETKYFGRLSYTEEEEIYFENGLFGFEDAKRFILIRFDNESGNILCLQNIENSNLAFTLMNPFAFLSEYAPVPSAEDIKKIGATDINELLFYNICVIQPNLQESTVNLRSPIVVNPETQKGIQVILEDTQYSFKYEFENFLKED